MFEFSAGSLALCLVDTIGDWGGAGVERLHTPIELAQWLKEAGLMDGECREERAADLHAARRLRNAIYCSVVALIESRPPAPADIELINRMARGMPRRPQWREGRIEQLAKNCIGAALAEIAADAVTVLAVPLIHRVRLCPECRMVFVDRSAAGRRRWCSSASGCGNRAKVRRHRARRSSEGKQG